MGSVFPTLPVNTGPEFYLMYLVHVRLINNIMVKSYTVGKNGSITYKYVQESSLVSLPPLMWINPLLPPVDKQRDIRLTTPRSWLTVYYSE